MPLSVFCRRRNKRQICSEMVAGGGLQAHVKAMAGGCLAMGLRFAGTCHPAAAATLRQQLHYFLACKKIVPDAGACRRCLWPPLRCHRPRRRRGLVHAPVRAAALGPRLVGARGGDAAGAGVQGRRRRRRTRWSGAPWRGRPARRPWPWPPSWPAPGTSPPCSFCEVPPPPFTPAATPLCHRPQPSSWRLRRDAPPHHQS